MKTQQEQIKAAHFAYIHEIANNRFAVYLQEPGKPLSALWPSNCEPKEAKKEFIPGQVYSRRKSNPEFAPYHFHLSGGGYNKEYDIAQELTRINPALEVYKFNSGKYPSFLKGGK